MNLLARMRSALFSGSFGSGGKGAERPGNPGSPETGPVRGAGALSSDSRKNGRQEARGRRKNEGARDEVFLVFADTGEVIRAEKRLAADAVAVRVMGPPPALRAGCDMVLVVPLAQAFAATALLEKHGQPPLRMVPCGGGMLEPVSLFQVKDYGDWLMVRAANMKVTVAKRDRIIVNVSGGGCPDVPWLAALLVGRPLAEAAVVKEYGSTLCGYALHLALEEMSRRLPEACEHA